MKDVNHAIAVLRDLTGLPVLELNANGHLELIFDDKISIDLVKIDDNHIELSSPLDIAQFEARLLGFVKYVAFWLSGEADELLPTTDHTPAPATDPSLMVIRS
jgi:hypothetical protein